MIEDLKQVRDALAEYKIDWRTRAGTIDPLDLCISTLDRIIADHIPDASKMVVPDVWQPIETAPKDGTVIDIWTTNRGRIVNVAYTLDDFDGTYYWGCENGGVYEPTHWMPLPDSPTTQPEKLDVEALKREVCETFPSMNGVERIFAQMIIDHLAATGRLKV